ncbi:hypothetical protein L2E24_25255, partial [Salmonella enterica subsp. enterica serovar Weltevreden]|uniref:hypothetical protein n=1 Tax=Salmonella enterica TaxID=28901 RepID=UPI001F339811
VFLKPPFSLCLRQPCADKLRMPDSSNYTAIHLYIPAPGAVPLHWQMSRQFYSLFIVVFFATAVI